MQDLTIVDKKCTTHIQSVCSSKGEQTNTIKGVFSSHIGSIGPIGSISGSSPAVGYGYEGYGRHKRSYGHG